MQTSKSEHATQIPEAKIAARIPRDRLYRMSKDFFDTIDRLALGHRGRRLLHGLVHAACKQNDDWHSRHVLPLEECLVACQALRHRLGMKGSDNRPLAAGLEELSHSGIFDVLAVCNDRQWLAWRMTDDAYACLFADPQYGYGYFDLQDVKKLRTVKDFRLHDRFGVIRAQKRPEAAFTIDASGPTWEKQRRSFVRALQRTAELYGSGFVVLLECHGNRTGIDRVTTRMHLPHTRWGASIVKRSAWEAQLRKVLLVDKDRCHEIAGVASYDDVQKFFAESKSLNLKDEKTPEEVRQG